MRCKAPIKQDLLTLWIELTSYLETGETFPCFLMSLFELEHRAPHRTLYLRGVLCIPPLAILVLILVDLGIGLRRLVLISLCIVMYALFAKRGVA